MVIGAGLLVKTIRAIEAGKYKEIPQNAHQENELKKAPKIFRDDCQINWDRPVKEVYNLIRGLSPYPAAFCQLQDKVLKIYRATAEEKPISGKQGDILTDNKTYLKFSCRDGLISVLELQLEGKKRMKVDEFLRGVRL